LIVAISIPCFGDASIQDARKSHVIAANREGNYLLLIGTSCAELGKLGVEDIVCRASGAGQEVKGVVGADEVTRHVQPKGIGARSSAAASAVVDVCSRANAGCERISQCRPAKRYRRSVRNSSSIASAISLGGNDGHVRQQDGPGQGRKLHRLMAVSQ
jgi:hypothetical protein